MKLKITIGLVAMLGLGTSAHAFTAYKADFTTKYPNLGVNLTAKVNNCTICHMNPNSGLNPTAYGTALRNAGGAAVAIATRIAGLEATDTDGDGFTNLEEINADTDFNDAASKPVSSGGGTTPAATTTFTVSSASFVDGGAMPLNLACVAEGGSNKSPQLSFANLPASTIAVAVIMEDISTSTPTVHWGMFQLPTSTPRIGSTPAGTPIYGDLSVTAIAEGNAVTQAQIEALDTNGVWATTTAAQNYTGGAGYEGPCPGGAQHTYKITALALDNIETNVAGYYGVAHATNPSYTDGTYAQILASPTVADFKRTHPNANILAEATLTGGFPNAVPSGGSVSNASSSSGGGGCLVTWSLAPATPLMILLLGVIVGLRKRSV